MNKRQVVWTCWLPRRRFWRGRRGSRLFSWEPAVYEGDAKRGGVVVASEFHLVDEDGKDRWVLASPGEASQRYPSSTGRLGAHAMGINQDGLPYFNMVLEPSGKGGPSLVLMDSQMRSRALLGLGQDGEPSLAMIDKEGRRRLILEAENSKRIPRPADGEGKPLHSWP